MRRLLPGAKELAVFAVLAILCTLIISQVQVATHDLAFAAMAFPIFLVAAVLGLRRSPAWTMEATDEADAEE